MSLNVLVGNVVFDLDAGAARVVVVKIPGRDRAVSLNTALNVDHASRAKIRPGEFFFARPNELDGFSGRSRQTRSFDCALAGVLAAIA